jgi:segregation and condensation protein A
MDATVKLEIFEGPLDLLLHLIRKNEVDIQDIPVSMITRQYLEYLRLMEERNIVLAGDFLVMAATLIYLKTKIMIPLPQAESEEDEYEDPRAGLALSLQELANLRPAVEFLERQPQLNRDVFNREEAAALALAGVTGGEEIEKVGIIELLNAFQRVLARKHQPQRLQLQPVNKISLEERMSQLLSSLRARRSMTFEECFDGDRDKDDLIVTFISLLELARQGMISLYQPRFFGEPAANAAAGGPPAQWGSIRIRFHPEMEEEADNAG